MITIEQIEVFNFKGALRGMRNALESWDKSDSFYGCTLSGVVCDCTNCDYMHMCDCKWEKYHIGPEDLALANKLCKAGSSHRKFLRQIFTCMDITAPMSWWWDADTYKIGTVKNSTSRMHKLGKRLLTVEDFSFDDEMGVIQLTPVRENFLSEINGRIAEWQKLDKDTLEAKDLWRGIVLDLGTSYNFKATWTANYEVLHKMYYERRNHKQREFKDFCKMIESLPYAKELICCRG